MKIVYFLFGLWMFCYFNEPIFAKHKLNQKDTYVRKSLFHSNTIYGSYRLKQALDNIVSNSEPDAEIAVYVKSMKYGDALYSRNIHHSLTPASTLKVLTAEAALLFLGPSYRFSTQLLSDSKIIKNGILQGNLYIVLSGDPTLTYFDLEELLENLKAQQIFAISGNVYIDNTAYDQRFYGPGWDQKDKENCYGAPISASIINHNCLAFKVSPSKVGHASSRYFHSPTKNKAVIRKGKLRNCSLHLSKVTRNKISIDGCMRRDRPSYGFSSVVTDIPEYNRALFKNLLKRLGINVYGKVTFGSAPDKLSFVAQHTSDPLKILIKTMLKKSDNVIAGALFKKIGQLYFHQPGSWENGSLAVSKILSKNIGMNTAGLRILDGSGLSPDNLLTPTHMMQVLDFAYHHDATSFEFVSALPIAGIDGTLKNRLNHVARRVRAKTGTISGVISLAGYAITTEKEALAFVIMVNGKKDSGWRYREMEDEIVTVLTRYSR